MSCTCETLEAKLLQIETMLSSRLTTLEGQYQGLNNTCNSLLDRVQTLEDRLNTLENTPIDITQAVKTIFGVN